MRVIDNFLPSYQWKQVEGLLMGDNIPWYYNDSIIAGPKKRHKFQFTHTFYNVIQEPYRKPSTEGNRFIVDIFCSILGITDLYRIKANLIPRTVFHRKGGYHIDTSDTFVERCKTSIFYINTNNGWTHIKGHGKVKSVANRLVTFDSNLYHTGYTCTDENIRVLINLNYESN